MKTATRRLTWRCGYRSIEVVVQEDVRRRPGSDRPTVTRQRCMDEEPGLCPDECLFRGGSVNPKNV
jgi:hypothetical protein